MDLNVEIKDTKIIVSWQKINADYYRVFCKKDDIFYECAKIYDNNSIRFSLVPFGENECFVQAVKDGIVIDESRKHKFKFDDIDVIYNDHLYSTLLFIRVSAIFLLPSAHTRSPCMIIVSLLGLIIGRLPLSIPIIVPRYFSRILLFFMDFRRNGDPESTRIGQHMS